MIDAEERALDLLDEEGTSVSVASASAARHAIEELLVDLMSAVRSGAKRGGGGGKQRVDKAASIMQQILRRKADGLDGDGGDAGGDDGAHEMLAKTDQPTKVREGARDCARNNAYRSRRDTRLDGARDQRHCSRDAPDHTRDRRGIDRSPWAGCAPSLWLVARPHRRSPNL